MKNTIAEELFKFLNPIHGADPEGEADEDQEDGNEDQEDQERPKPGDRRKKSSADDDDDDDDKDLDAVDDPKAKRIFELSNENRKKRLALRELREELAALKKDKEAKDSEGKSESSRLKTDNTKLTEANQKLTKTNENLLLKQGVLSSKSYRFHDVDDVIAFVDRKEIDIDAASGTIEGLGEELKRLAREKPYLVSEVIGKKPQQKQEQDDNGEKHGASGFNPGGAGNGSKQKANADRARLVSKYNLNRR